MAARLKYTEKPTHTHQYLLWSSGHPTAHKLSVVRTLFDRTSTITDNQDKEEEENHIKQALKICKYPTWAINKGKREVQKNNKEEKKKKGSKPENLSMITLPYVGGVMERIQRAMKKR